MRVLNYRELTQLLHRLTISDLAKRDKFKPIKRNGQFFVENSQNTEGVVLGIGKIRDNSRHYFTKKVICTTIHDIILPNK